MRGLPKSADAEVWAAFFAERVRRYPYAAMDIEWLTIIFEAAIIEGKMAGANELHALNTRDT